MFYRLHDMCQFFVIGKGKCKGKASQTTDIHQKNNDKPRDKIKLSGQSVVIPAVQIADMTSKSVSPSGKPCMPQIARVAASPANR